MLCIGIDPGFNVGLCLVDELEPVESTTLRIEASAARRDPVPLEAAGALAARSLAVARELLDRHGVRQALWCVEVVVKPDSSTPQRRKAALSPRVLVPLLATSAVAGAAVAELRARGEVVLEILPGGHDAKPVPPQLIGARPAGWRPSDVPKEGRSHEHAAYHVALTGLARYRREHAADLTGARRAVLAAAPAGPRELLDAAELALEAHPDLLADAVDVALDAVLVGGVLPQLLDAGGRSYERRVVRAGLARLAERRHRERVAQP